MMKFKHAGTIALLAGALLLGTSAGSTSANAAPAAAKVAAGQTSITDSNLIDVRDGRRGGRRHWRGGGRRGGNWGGRHRGRGYYNNNGAWIGLGVAGALLGGALANGYYDDGPRYSSYGYRGSGSSAMRRCAAQFKSFEWDTGRYTTYGGESRLCPYLR